MTRPNSALIFILTLVATGAAGTMLLIYSTPQGLGLSDDSIAYIAGARSLLQGNGYREIWLASAQPVTHLPPGFSVVLAAVGWFPELDPLRSARLVNSLLFGGSSMLMGMIGWKATRSRVAGILLALFFAANASMLRLHADAFSEPLYIFISLLAFLSFSWYVTSERTKVVLPRTIADSRFHRGALSRLVLCGLLVGAAYLTRYAGLSLLATVVVAGLLLNASGRRRGQAIVAVLAGALPWIAGWSVRNRLLGGSSTNRALVWHPITGQDLDAAIHNLSEFLVPVETWRKSLIQTPGFFQAVLVLVGTGLCLWLLYAVLRRVLRPGAPQPEILALLSGLYIASYLTSLLTAMTLFDASTKFSLRILAPTYVSFLVLLVAAGAWIVSRSPFAVRTAVLALAVVALGLSIWDTSQSVADLRRGGGGYASFKWYDSQALAFLRGLPPETKVYTNEPGATYLYTGRGAYVLPSIFDPVTAQARSGFEEGVALMQQQIRSGEAVLALFDGAEILPEEATALTDGLHVAHKSAGDEIYTATPR